MFDSTVSPAFARGLAETAVADPVLKGIRVLELTTQLSGPYGAMILADLGADVIKIESPHRPDAARFVPAADVGGESAYFLSLNRNKRSVQLDLKTEQDRDAFMRLVSVSDVVLDNFRPGVTDRLGIGFGDLSAVNPSIVTCSLSGFGHTGPLRDRPGYDYLMQALAGTMDLTGDPDGPPTKYGISVVDHVGGLFAVIGILAALTGRDRDPKRRGQNVDVALLDTHLSMLSYLASEALNGGEIPARQRLSAHPTLVPAQAFRTRDSYVVVMPLANHFFVPLCNALGMPEVSGDMRFVDAKQRLAHRDALLQLLEPRFAEETSTHWVAVLERHGVPVAPVQTVSEALEMGQTMAREMVIELHHEDYGTYRAVGNPLKMPGRDQPLRAAPRAGQHTIEVLTELAGLDAEQVATLGAGT